MRQARVDPPQLLQRCPGRPLTDREVLVVWFVPPLVRGMADAHAQPHANKVKYCRNLVFPQGIRLVIAAHNGGDGGQRLGLVEQRIRRGNRHVRRHDAVDHVAEIEDAGHVPVAHKHVVVVGVAVNHGVAQPAQPWARLLRKMPKQPLDQRPPLRVGDLVLVLPDHIGRLRYVPVKGTPQRRVVVASQRCIQPAHKAAQVCQQCLVMRLDQRQRLAVNVAQQPHPVLAPVPACHGRD